MTDALGLLLAYLLIGAFAGTMAGLLGVGGGLIIVPALAAVFAAYGLAEGVVMHVAVGTSLATIVATSLSSIRAHHRHQAVLWPVWWRMTPGILLGALLGAAVAETLPSADLRLVFGVFELLVATQMALDVKPAAHRDVPGRPALAAGGGVIGAVSAVVGVGGGTLTVPYLLWCNVPVRKAIGTSAACGLPIAVAGTLGFAVTGWGDDRVPEWSMGYVYWPVFAGIVASTVLFAPLGAALAHRLPTRLLKRFFALFLAVLGVRMLVGS